MHVIAVDGTSVGQLVCEILIAKGVRRWDGVRSRLHHHLLLDLFFDKIGSESLGQDVEGRHDWQLDLVVVFSARFILRLVLSFACLGATALLSITCLVLFGLLFRSGTHRGKAISGLCAAVLIQSLLVRGLVLLFEVYDARGLFASKSCALHALEIEVDCRV